jgi:hypothetical protein
MTVERVFPFLKLVGIDMPELTPEGDDLVSEVQHTLRQDRS